MVNIKNAIEESTAVNGSVRQLRIRQLIETNEFVDLETLHRETAASVSTLRRDLIELEEQGLLKRVYGGAMASAAVHQQRVRFPHAKRPHA